MEGEVGDGPSNGQELKCSACGLPPRDNKPLKRCSRCKKVWYHDLDCQKRHFPTHKKECKRGTIEVARPKASPPEPAKHNENKIKIETREGRDRCIVATSQIQMGDRIQDEKSEQWQPLVPPALFEAQRSIRCAHCFRSLPEEFFRFEEIKPRPQYFMLFCSHKCRDEGRRLLLDKEESAIGRLYARSGPPRIFSTAILLFRILVAIQNQDNKGVVKEALEKLQCQTGEVPDVHSSSYHHSQAVMATTVAMLQESRDVGLSIPPLEEMADMLNRIKINGFSISDGESATMGVGLYATPSFMNHSCLPNATQTYMYGHQSPPSLLVTACKDIDVNQEICISYTDNYCPLHLRRERLRNDYFFLCTCEACSDNDREARICGLRCSRCKLDDQRAILVDAMAPSPPTYQCPGCENTDFDMSMQSLRGFERDLSCERSQKDLSREYNKMKATCYQDSWYVQESGDRFVQSLLDSLANAETPDDQEKAASNALAVLEDLIGSSGSSSMSNNLMRKNIHRLKAAKLRLFLFQDAREAVEEIQTAKRYLSLYFPQNHELSVNLDMSLQDART